MTASLAPAGSPTRLGRYEVRAKIGDGGMATVYLGRLSGPPGIEGAFERVVALKVIREDLSKHPEFTTMFLDEAKIVSGLSHPNLVQVIELGKEGDRLFIAMELLLGQSLWDVWDACRARNVRLRYDLLAWIGARVAEGLHHAHEAKDATGQPLQLVHRDVNASNIFVTYEGHVKVIDFGLAKARNRAYKTAAGVVKGKLAYLSPEQVDGKPVDRRSDVFALGTTLWELTTDRRLFRVQDDAETLRRVHAAQVPDPTSLVDGYPRPLWDVLKKALSRDPAARYATAAEMARALDAFARSEGRAVDAMALGAVMRELFANERTRDAAWVVDASSVERPAPAQTMHPPPPPLPPPPPADAAPAPLPREVTLASAVWPQGAPPEGMFAPPSTRIVDVLPKVPAATPLEKTRPSATSSPPAEPAAADPSGLRAFEPSEAKRVTPPAKRIAIIAAVVVLCAVVLWLLSTHS